MIVCFWFIIFMGYFGTPILEISKFWYVQLHNQSCLWGSNNGIEHILENICCFQKCICRYLSLFTIFLIIPKRIGQMITIQIWNLDNILREVASFLVLFEAIQVRDRRYKFEVAPKEGWALPKLINNDSTSEKSFTAAIIWLRVKTIKNTFTLQRHMHVKRWHEVLFFPLSFLGFVFYF